MVRRFVIRVGQDFRPARPDNPAASTLRRDTDVLGARTNQLSRRVLLDGVPDPPDAPADRKEHQWRTRGQPEYSGDRREAEVDVGFFAGEARRRLGELHDEAILGGSRAPLAEQIEQQPRARVAVAVQRVSEAIDWFATPQPRAH